ncbi:MAG: hypothetical protein H0X03_09820 [Nitrosopumilus sp.]|nr:hypothetical protein [Nitrosopumilus sp.]
MYSSKPKESVKFSFTTSTISLKNLFDTLHVFKNECQLVVDKNGIKIVEFNAGKNILTKILLSSEKFDNYFCESEIRILFGIQDMINQLNKNIAKNFTIKNPKITIQMLQTHELCVLDENNIIDAKINLIENLDESRKNDFSNFHKFTCDMQKYVNIIDMLSWNNKIIKLEINNGECQFSNVCSESGKFTFTFKDSNKNTEHVELFFKKDDIRLSTKLHNLSDELTIYSKNDFPLVFEIKLESGNLLMFVNPISVDNNLLNIS